MVSQNKIVVFNNKKHVNAMHELIRLPYTVHGVAQIDWSLRETAVIQATYQRYSDFIYDDPRIFIIIRRMRAQLASADGLSMLS